MPCFTPLNNKPRSLPKIERYVGKMNIESTVLLDPNRKLSRLFKISDSIPYLLIIDKKGNIVYRRSGYKPSYEKYIRKKPDRVINETEENSP